MGGEREQELAELDEIIDYHPNFTEYTNDCNLRASRAIESYPGVKFTVDYYYKFANYIKPIGVHRVLINGCDENTDLSAFSDVPHVYLYNCTGTPNLHCLKKCQSLMINDQKVFWASTLDDDKASSYLQLAPVYVKF